MESADGVLSVPQLNAFDAAPGRTVVVTQGDLFQEAIDVDLLVISAWVDHYEPDPGSMVAVLLEKTGIRVGELPRELDLRGAPTIRAWVTPPLESLPSRPQWPEASSTRFRRLAVVESPREVPPETTEQAVFQQMFCLLALLPMHGIECSSVATPLLNTGRQKAQPEELYPAMITAVGNGFRHVPDLRELVIFDLKGDDLKKLCEEIDEKLSRSPLQREIQSMKPEHQGHLEQLLDKMADFQKRHEELMANPEVQKSFAEIVNQLHRDQITLVTLGTSARKLLECLVAKRVGVMGKELGLYRQVQLFSRRISGWSLSAIDTVRTFGNWMAHANPEWEEEQIPHREVEIRDVLAMIFALERVLDDYPWRSVVKYPIRRKHPRAIPR